MLLSIVQLSRFFSAVLFKRQLLYFIKSFSLCQELFNFFQSFYLLRSFSRVSLDIISFVLLNVNTFFKVFSFSSKLILYHSRYHLIILTYKNYWLSSIFPDDIKRRKRDLNPRAGHPTYTLSRGTSSASWVFLLTELNCISTVIIQLALTVRNLLYKKIL